NASGDYTLAGLPIAGETTLVASAAGFAPRTISGLTLIGGESARIDIQLGLPGTTATVTVTGVAGQVRSDQPQLGDRLGAAQIEATPLLGNQITSLPLLNSANRPAINMGDVFTNQTLITTNGSGRRQTSFAIDGANGNDSWGRQTIFTAIPPQAVQEMTVLENAFSAEYGATTGGVVNIVTRSGGPTWHGMGAYTVRPNGLAAGLSGLTPASAAAHPGNDVFNQGDWALSGPLGSRTQFALAGELSIRHRGSPIISPLAPGVFNGIYRGGLFFGRLDRQISANQSLFLRANADSFYDTNPNGSVGGNTLPSTDRVFKRRTYALALGDTDALSPNLVNALRLQFQLASPITQFQPVNNSTAFVVPITGAPTFTSGTSQSALLLNRQYEVGDTLSGNWGAHNLIFGGDAIISRNGGDSKEFGGPAFLGSFNFAPCTGTLAFCDSPAWLNLGNAVSFTQSFGTGNYTVTDTLGSAFVQDNYQLRQDLTLNLGLRYERQSFTQATKDWAPRLGFAWHPRANSVVRGGYGIYYSQIHDNAEADYVLSGPTGVFNFSAAKNQPGFPSTLAPLKALPTGAAIPRRSLFLRPGFAGYYNQFLPTSILNGYPSALLNPYSEQWTLGLEQRFPGAWVLSADYIGSHTLRIDRPLDIDAPPAETRTAQNQWRGVINNPGGSLTCAASGQTNLSSAQASACASTAANAARPLWIYDAAIGVTPAYDVVQTTVSQGVAWYDALEINLNHPFSHNLQT
ncbi:MAG: TonB-dependent receptor, partial [Terriglobales bacterium]